MNGYILTQRANITKYFTLGDENQRLQAENNALRKQVLESYYIDRGDTIRNTDTSFRQRFDYIPGNVIQNSTDLVNNYITVDKGTRHGIKKNRGVISPQGLVGRVVAVSENFCIVMSVLNSKFSIIPKSTNNAYLGKLAWKGGSPYYVTIERINKFNVIKKGEIIRTNSSKLFPENLIIGKVADIKSDPSGSYFDVKIKLATNFTNLRSVYIINNLQLDEIETLEQQIQSGN
jgi:rod shape-determining protein MreC